MTSGPMRPITTRSFTSSRGSRESNRARSEGVSHRQSAEKLPLSASRLSFLLNMVRKSLESLGAESVSLTNFRPPSLISFQFLSPFPMARPLPFGRDEERDAWYNQARRVKMKKRVLIASIFLAIGSVAFAGGVAPWWEWKSPTGDIVCAQASPGKGWVKWTGPYSDLKCSMKEGQYRVKEIAPPARTMSHPEP